MAICLPISNDFNMQCTSKDEKFANVAMEEALKSDVLSQHGCVAVMNGKIIAKGYNSSRCYSSDGFLKNTCSCHAEVDVLRKLFHQYKSTRINNMHNGSRYTRRSSRNFDSSSPSSFNVEDDRWCFLFKKRKPLCGT